MNRPLQLLIATRRAKYALDGLRDYGETLERLLNSETARVLAHETLADISARSRNSTLDPEEPSDELVGLRDSFPTILRGSLLPYVHGNFERSARRIANLFLPGNPIEKGKNTNKITARVNAAWPGTITGASALQLADYMHLRHACSHTAGEVGSALFEPKHVAKAAERTAGAFFRPYADVTDPSLLTAALRWSGLIDFDVDFLPTAIAFHGAQLELIAKAVVAPPVSSARTE